MYLLTVIPISRGIGTEELMYFSSKNIPLGTVVMVPLRSKNVPALIIKSDDAVTQRETLRHAHFSLKKIGTDKGYASLSPALIAAARRLADHNATTTGAVLATLVPKFFFEHSFMTPFTSSLPAHTDIASERLLFQASLSERMEHHKKTVREYFAREQSLLVIFPTTIEAEAGFKQWNLYAPEHTLLMYTTLPKKKRGVAFTTLTRETHPLLIITTPAFFGIQRHDIGCIIVEHESSAAYVSHARPFLDLRNAAEFLAREMHVPIIFADSVVRVETYARLAHGDVNECAPSKVHYRELPPAHILDMRRKEPSGHFNLLHTEVERLLRGISQTNEHIFIYVARRGLSPVTICRDCGTTVACDLCHAPVVLHRNSEGNQFTCHRCGKTRSAKEHCRVCASWRLEKLGIGSETVEQTLREAFPEIPIYRLDSDTASNASGTKKIVAAWETNTHGILVGTDLALSYLPVNTEAISRSIIASLDSLFSIPDFRINEKIVALVTHLKEISAHGVMIQTRMPERSALRAAAEGNIGDFFREELHERETLGYPPYRTFIKLTREGNRSVVEKDMHDAKKFLEPYPLVLYPAPFFTKGQFTLHALIAVLPGEWPDKKLLERLRALPPSFAIDVNPESVL